MTQIVVSLQSSERDALKVLARNERRNIRAQAAMLIRSELERSGLLTADAPSARISVAQEVNYATLQPA